jgi:copper(I)-binding protein
VIRARSGKTAGRLLLGGGVLAILIPAIAGCEAGADAPTLQFHQAAAGAYGTASDISVSNAWILGAPADSTLQSGSSASMFVSISNSGSTADTLESATAKGAASVSLSGGTVSLPANGGTVNLTGPQPEIVISNLSAPVSGGGTIAVTLNFQHAGTMSLQVPVMAQAYYYSTFSPPVSGGGSVSPGSAATAPALGGAASATPSSSAGGSATPTSTP